MKKSYRYGWFVAEGECGRSIPAGDEVVQVRNFFNEDNITWSKGTSPVYEVRRKVSGVIEKFQFLQSEGDVLSTTRLARASLIEEGLPSSLGGDSCMVIWCCWGTLPSLVLWGAPIICTILFFFILVTISYFY